MILTTPQHHRWAKTTGNYDVVHAWLESIYDIVDPKYRRHGVVWVDAIELDGETGYTVTLINVEPPWSDPLPRDRHHIPGPPPQWVLDAMTWTRDN